MSATHSFFLQYENTFCLRRTRFFYNMKTSFLYVIIIGMARTNYLDIPAGQEEKYYGGLQSGDRFVFPRIVRKNAFFSRKKIANLKAKSYLPIISDLWAGFTDGQKSDWKDVDPHTKQHGWRTFVADQSKRIKLGSLGLLHQTNFIKIWLGG